MCTSPIVLHRCHKEHTLRSDAYLARNPKQARRLYPDEFIVPCGHCLECLRARQNDYAQVYVLAAARYGSMQFVTLTYRNATLPVRVYDEDDNLVSDPDIINLCRECYIHKPKQHYDKQSVLIGDLDFDVYPTLNRKDVQLWLKRSREYWVSVHGERLPDFKYSLIPEYGYFGRPHYHLVFFGLSKPILDELTQSWRASFGFVCVDEVPVSSNNDVGKVANYVSKYVTKGSFEAQILKKYPDYIEHPRICSSSNLVSLSEQYVNYFNGLDIRNCSPSEMVDRVIARRGLLIGDYRYRLGRHLIDYLTKTLEYDYEFIDVIRKDDIRPLYDESGNLLVVEKLSPRRKANSLSVYKEIVQVSSKTTRSPLQEVCKNRLLELHDSCSVRQYQKLPRPSSGEESLDNYVQISEIEKVAREERESLRLQSLKSIYQHSKI